MSTVFGGICGDKMGFEIVEIHNLEDVNQRGSLVISGGSFTKDTEIHPQLRIPCLPRIIRVVYA